MFPAFARGLCDDAAVFPPGLAPLPEAATRAVPVRIRALEIAVPARTSPGEFFAELDERLDTELDREFDRELDTGPPDAIEVFVEVPRDERRAEIIAGCARAGYRAKFRTGGVRAELYPDESELAGSVRAAIEAGVPFKATAGLHHASRNTDPETGFEQHGFLNVLLAVEAVLRGADPASVLADRDGPAIADRVAALAGPMVRELRARFVSFGTCSITEPLAELVDLGLVPAAVGEGVTS